MFRRKIKTEPYDRENLKPVIYTSICSGEQIAGFRNVRTGRFTEIMAIRGRKDMEEFLTRYGVCEEEIKKEW